MLGFSPSRVKNFPRTHNKWLILSLAIKIGNAFIYFFAQLPRIVINYNTILKNIQWSRRIFRSWLGFHWMSWNCRWWTPQLHDFSAWGKTFQLSSIFNFEERKNLAWFSWFFKDCVGGKCPSAINQFPFAYKVTIFRFRGDNEKTFIILSLQQFEREKDLIEKCWLTSNRICSIHAVPFFAFN